jgi:hypothetical protein
MKNLHLPTPESPERMDMRIAGWNLVELLLPCPGAMVDFSHRDDRRVLCGRFGNGGFHELLTGDFYEPPSILCWRLT